MSVSSLQETGEVTWVIGLSTNGDLTMNGVLMTNTPIHIPFKLDPSANRFEMSPNLPRGYGGLSMFIMVQWSLLNELRGTIINAPPDACVVVDIYSLIRRGVGYKMRSLSGCPSHSLPLSPTYRHNQNTIAKLLTPKPLFPQSIS